MMIDLVIIHSKDTEPWKDYIRGYLGKEVFNKRIVDKRDTDLIELHNDHVGQSEISSAKAIIIIASPLHLRFLIEFSSFNYSRFVTNIRRAQLFLCGVEISDFDAPDTNRLPIYDRFPNFIDWKKLSHSQHSDLLRNAMVLMESEEVERSSKLGKNGASGVKRRRKKEFDVSPLNVKCKESTVITIFFKDIMTEQDEQAQLSVAFRVPGGTIKINATWRNPYVYQFPAPDLPPGTHTFTATAKGNEIGSKQLIYNSNEHLCSASTDLIQVYVDQLTRLCRYICKTGLMTAEVDSLMAETINETSAHCLPSHASQQLFGPHLQHCRGNSSFEFPTMLHLAANFGLQEFATKLIDLPGAQTACIVKNPAGKIPETLAMDNSYDDLARLLQDFRVINETIYSTYEIYLPELGGGGNYLSDSSENSRTPTAAHSSSGSDDTYMTMQGSTKKKKQEDSDSETGYVDMETELQDLYISSEQKGEHKDPHYSPPQIEKPCHDSPPSSFLFTAMTAAGDCRELEKDDSGQWNLEGIPESQKELIEVLHFAKQGKITISEAEHLIKGWMFRHGRGRSRSFKDKQHQLSRLKAQLAKTRDSTVEQTCWESLIGLIATTTSSSPTSVSASIAVLTELEKSCSHSTPSSVAVNQHSSLADFACSQSAAEMEVNEKQICKKSFKQGSQQVSLQFLEPLSENAQRHSNISGISGSSRESVLSINSRASTSSGVEFDVADDENQSDLDSRLAIHRRGNENSGSSLKLQSTKRKSMNLERLEEELTSSEARVPPPLPPRATLAKQSSSLTSPPTFAPVQRSTPGSISLPSVPNRSEVARKRSSSDGCVATLASAGKSPHQFPPICLPRAGKHDTCSHSGTGRPLPPTPSQSAEIAERCHQIYTQVARNVEAIHGPDCKKMFGGESITRNATGSPIEKTRPRDGHEATGSKEFFEKEATAVFPLNTICETPNKPRSGESVGDGESHRMQSRNPRRLDSPNTKTSTFNIRDQ